MGSTVSARGRRRLWWGGAGGACGGACGGGALRLTGRPATVTPVADEDDGDDSWLTMKKRRKPPFNKWPLTLTPITEFPEEFDWEEDNVRYLTYGSFGSLVMCSCCMVLMVMMMKELRNQLIKIELII
jgi:hypothetical protein